VKLKRYDDDGIDIEESFRIRETPTGFLVEKLFTVTSGFMGRKKTLEWIPLTIGGYAPYRATTPLSQVHGYSSLKAAKHAARAFKRGHIIHAV